MPDLATHTLVGYLAGAGGGGSRRTCLWLAAGSALPDAASFFPVALLRALRLGLGVELDDRWPDGFQLFHTPAGYALLCAALALALPPAVRRLAFVAALGGGWLHLALDLLQRHLLGPAYHPGYPFLHSAWEAGLFWTEDSFRVLPWLAAVAFAAAWWRSRVEPPPAR